MPTRTRLRGRTITRALTAAVAALALTATVGCGGEPETNIEQADDKPDASEQDEQSKDDKPSPSPTPTGPEQEPYVQVALDYYEAFNKANDTGETDKLRQLSTADCEACELTADRLETIYGDGGHFEGGDLERIDEREIIAGGDPETGQAVVTIFYRYQKEVVYESADAEPKRFPTEETKKIFTLEDRGGKWKIAKIITEEPGKQD